MCARRGLGEAGEELGLLVQSHAAACVGDLEPEVGFFSSAPFGAVEDVDFGEFVVGEGDVLPAFGGAGPGAAEGDADFAGWAVFCEFYGVGAR